MPTADNDDGSRRTNNATKTLRKYFNNVDAIDNNFNNTQALQKARRSSKDDMKRGGGDSSSSSSSVRPASLLFSEFSKLFCETAMHSTAAQALAAESFINRQTAAAGRKSTIATFDNKFQTAINYLASKAHKRWRTLNLFNSILICATALMLWHCCSAAVLGANAAPQSCIYCDNDNANTKDNRNLNGNKQPPQQQTNQEFLFEHQVTRQDAINALKMLNATYYDEPPPETSCKTIACTRDIKQYCMGQLFINDHCLCEFGHFEEGLPYVPHICYLGQKLHKASVGTCILYEELKICCCGPLLAKKWRYISAAHRLSAMNCFLFVISTMCPFLRLIFY